jgi:HK97 family phage prohead protease
MDDYETSARRRDEEDKRRGFSISSGGGWITHVGHRPTEQKPVKKSNKPQFLDGFACLYGVKHFYKNRWEIFERGCFNGSLNGVFALVDHKFATKKLGDQDDDTLELLDTDVGLAFRLKLTPESLERLDGRDSMSCSYIEHEVETRKIGNDTVRVIKSASLFEISACYVGSVRNTFAVVRDADTVGSLRDEVKNNFAMESASTIFKRALRNIA